MRGMVGCTEKGISTPKPRIASAPRIIYKPFIKPLTSSRARAMVAKTGRLVGIHLRSHGLRRHAATYASRSGVPIEMVSKVILRHAGLATTQRYLGKISDAEAMRWIENLYA